MRVITSMKAVRLVAEKEESCDVCANPNCNEALEGSTLMVNGVRVCGSEHYIGWVFKKASEPIRRMRELLID